MIDSKKTEKRKKRIVETYHRDHPSLPSDFFKKSIQTILRYKLANEYTM